MTQEKVLSLFDYKDGYLYWKVPIVSYKQVGTIAGYQMDKRYWCISIDKKIWRAHRLIFLWHHGYLPQFIDHMDQNKINNKIENLRAATKGQNMANCGKIKSNTSGYKGVSKIKGTDYYEARIQVNGKQIFLGRFKNPLEAHYAYKYNALYHFKEFAHV